MLRIEQIIGKEVKVMNYDGKLHTGRIVGMSLSFPIVSLGLGWSIEISAELAARAINNDVTIRI